MVRRRRTLAQGEPDMGKDAIEAIGRATSPLQNVADLDRLIDRIGNARYVLLGEATHGTHEFYTWRAEITRR